MINIVLSWGKCLLDFILFLWLSVQFFNSKWAKNRIVPCILLFVLSTILYLVNSLQLAQLNTIAALACALAINIFLFNGSITARIVCSIAEVLLIVICEFTPIIIYSMISRNDIAVTADELIRNAAFSLISTGLFSITILLLRYCISVKKRKHNNDITINDNLFIIFVPLMSILIIYHLLYLHNLNPLVNDVIDWQSLFVFAGILLMNVVVMIGDSNSRKQFWLQRELDRLNQLERQNKIVIDQQDHFIEELKGFAHDYIKQIDDLRYLLNTSGKGEDKQSRICIDELLESVDSCYRFAFIPTPALRAILSRIQLDCGSADILFESDIQFADFDFLSFPDLHSIFENPLANAVCACREIKDEAISRRISLSILRKKNLVWIEINNTKDQSIKIKGNRIVTTKADSNYHGFGIKNMNRTIKKYGGYSDISYTANRFSVTMAIPYPAAVNKR